MSTKPPWERFGALAPPGFILALLLCCAGCVSEHCQNWDQKAADARCSALYGPTFSAQVSAEPPARSCSTLPDFGSAAQCWGVYVACCPEGVSSP